MELERTDLLQASGSRYDIGRFLTPSSRIPPPAYPEPCLAGWLLPGSRGLMPGGMPLHSSRWCQLPARP